MPSKFKALTHNGPIFPAEYQARGYKLSNEALPPLAEETLWAYFRLTETDYVQARSSLEYSIFLKRDMLSIQVFHRIKDSFRDWVYSLAHYMKLSYRFNF